jgi:hypothetical protein
MVLGLQEVIQQDTDFANALKVDITSYVNAYEFLAPNNR